MSSVQRGINDEINAFNSAFLRRLHRFQAGLRRVFVSVRTPQSHFRHQAATNSDPPNRQLLAHILTKSQVEIGSKYTKISTRVARQDPKKERSPFISILERDPELFIDLRELFRVFENEQSESPRQFLKSLNERRELILFAEVNCLLRLFWIALHKSPLKTSEPCLIFVHPKILVELFFLVRIFGLCTMHLGLKFLRSEPD